MGFITLNDSVTVIVAAGLDDWGEAQGGSRAVYKARITFNSKVAPIGSVKGTEIVGTARVLLEGLLFISYDDTIEIKDRAGNIRQFKPLSIGFKSDMSGIVLYTVVEV